MRTAILSVLLAIVLGLNSVGFASTNHVQPLPPTPPLPSTVIGQVNFTSPGQATGTAQLGSPEYVALDRSGNLWVSDYQDGWVSEFPSPFSNGERATMEIGAANFSAGGCTTGDALCEPAGIAFDASGNLWAADGQNASVKEFRVPFSLGETPTVSLGGRSLAGAPTSSSFGPAGVAFDASGNLWVVDSSFNRILEFTAPFTNHEAASLVIGQASFTTSSNNSSQSRLEGPTSLTFDHAGNLWVADTYDNRILEFKAPFSNGEGASIAIGQPNLLSTNGNTTQSTLSLPEGVAFDSNGNLWVSDTDNNRVVEFVPPLSTGMGATVVLGQDAYFFSGSGIEQSTMNGPEGIAAGGGGDLWVADTGNYRVLLFIDPASAAYTSATTSLTTSEYQTQSSASQVATSSASTVTKATIQGVSVPEFPIQYAILGAFTVVVAATYLLVRNRHTPRYD
ncbi:MAG TPA: NHL repeat-containing protein [Nitrososphaerales archaeon]|nr:NHL repeat-containing protein [Nitrososphaerales archaeon]